MSQNQGPSQQEINYQWLVYAKDNYTSVQNGVAPTNSPGGESSARFTWDVDTPRNPFWAWAVGWQFKIVVDLTLPAGGSATISPFAPYSGVGVQLTIGGGQAIQPVSLVPFWLDYLTWGREFDFAKTGPDEAINDGSSRQTAGSTFNKIGVADWEFDGTSSSVPSILDVLDITDSSGNHYVPGQVISNGGTVSETLVITFTFRAWMQLARKLYGRTLEDLTGCIPMGDPANRPILNTNINSLINTFPERCMFTNASAGVTAVTDTNTAPTAQQVWVCKEQDQLPDGVQVGSPKVLSALEVNTNSGAAIPNAGQFLNLEFDTAMVYNKRFHILVNNQAPISADYFGLWYSENKSNDRWHFTADENNMQEYFRRTQRVYGRNLPIGVYVADMVGGEFPEFPRETPYRGEIVTSTTLAALTGLKPYPNAQTTIRIPSGTTMSNAYCTTYSFGTVPVSY